MSESEHDIPEVTSEQMVEVDRAMVQDYHIDLVQMMESAGRNLAHLARVRFLAGDPRKRAVVVLAGTGGNGSGALVCARRLHGWGARVQVILAAAAQKLRPVASRQLNILERMGVPVDEADAVAEENTGIWAELIIDGIVGYNLKGTPSSPVAELIRWANQQPAPILALDVPSGLDATTGEVHEPAIRATATLTLALPKSGLQVSGTEAQVGELYLGDIGVPPSVYASPALGLQVEPVFAQDDIVRLR
jgi:NAD(P)H-hydrate epimerase